MTDRSQTATTIQNAVPYAGQLPFLVQGWNAASQYLNRGALVPDAYSTIAARAAGGNPSLALAPEYLRGVLGAPQRADLAMLSGIMQNPGSNPDLDAMYRRAADQVTSGIQSEFARAGRYGSGAMADVTGRNLVDLASQFYGGQYNADQSRRLQAAQLFGAGYGSDLAQRIAAAQALPSAALSADFAYPEELAKVQQASIDAPASLVQRYMQMIGGPIGGQTTTESPHFTSPLGQGIGAIGGLANAANLGSSALFRLNALFPSLFGNGAAGAGAGSTIGGFGASPDLGGPLLNLWGEPY